RLAVFHISGLLESVSLKGVAIQSDPKRQRPVRAERFFVEEEAHVEVECANGTELQPESSMCAGKTPLSFADLRSYAAQDRRVRRGIGHFQKQRPITPVRAQGCFGPQRHDDLPRWRISWWCA